MYWVYWVCFIRLWYRVARAACEDTRAWCCIVAVSVLQLRRTSFKVFKSYYCADVPSTIWQTAVYKRKKKSRRRATFSSAILQIPKKAKKWVSRGIEPPRSQIWMMLVGRGVFNGMFDTANDSSGMGPLTLQLLEDEHNPSTRPQGYAQRYDSPGLSWCVIGDGWSVFGCIYPTFDDLWWSSGEILKVGNCTCGNDSIYQ